MKSMPPSYEPIVELNEDGDLFIPDPNMLEMQIPPNVNIQRLTFNIQDRQMLLYYTEGKKSAVDVPKVNMSSKKDEIYAAYKEALEILGG